MCLISCLNSSLVYLNSTIRYTIHDTIQNITIHDTKYDSTSMIKTIESKQAKENFAGSLHAKSIILI
jgi:hypothetical protein